jgi:hypothetical protein
MFKTCIPKFILSTSIALSASNDNNSDRLLMTCRFSEGMIKKSENIFNNENLLSVVLTGTTPVAARSEACVCGRLLTGIAGSNPAKRHGCLSLVSVV